MEPEQDERTWEVRDESGLLLGTIEHSWRRSICVAFEREYIGLIACTTVAGIGSNMLLRNFWQTDRLTALRLIADGVMQPVGERRNEPNELPEAN